MAEHAAALASFCPRQLLRLIAQNGMPTEPQVESFDGVVLFIDVAGFSNLSSNLEKEDGQYTPAAGMAASTAQGERQGYGAENLSHLLNEYFEQLISTIQNDFGGDVVKFAGDALLIVWRNDMPQQPAATRQAGSPSAATSTSNSNNNTYNNTNNNNVSSNTDADVGVSPRPRANTTGHRRRPSSMQLLERRGSIVSPIRRSSIISLASNEDLPSPSSGSAPTPLSLGHLVHVAARCAMNLSKRFDGFPVGEDMFDQPVRLRLHMSIAAGIVHLFMLSTRSRWQLILAGEAVVAAASCVDEAATGEVVLHKRAYELAHELEPNGNGIAARRHRLQVTPLATGTVRLDCAVRGHERRASMLSTASTASLSTLLGGGARSSPHDSSLGRTLLSAASRISLLPDSPSASSQGESVASPSGASTPSRRRSALPGLTFQIAGSGTSQASKMRMMESIPSTTTISTTGRTDDGTNEEDGDDDDDDDHDGSDINNNKRDALGDDDSSLTTASSSLDATSARRDSARSSNSLLLRRLLAHPGGSNSTPTLLPSQDAGKGKRRALRLGRRNQKLRQKTGSRVAQNSAGKPDDAADADGVIGHKANHCGAESSDADDAAVADDDDEDEDDGDSNLRCVNDESDHDAVDCHSLELPRWQSEPSKLIQAFPDAITLPAATPMPRLNSIRRISDLPVVPNINPSALMPPSGRHRRNRSFSGMSWTGRYRDLASDQWVDHGTAGPARPFNPGNSQEEAVRQRPSPIPESVCQAITRLAAIDDDGTFDLSAGAVTSRSSLRQVASPGSSSSNSSVAVSTTPKRSPSPLLAQPRRTTPPAVSMHRVPSFLSAGEHRDRATSLMSPPVRLRRERSLRRASLDVGVMSANRARVDAAAGLLSPTEVSTRSADGVAAGMLSPTSAITVRAPDGLISSTGFEGAVASAQSHSVTMVERSSDVAQLNPTTLTTLVSPAVSWLLEGSGLAAELRLITTLFVSLGSAADSAVDYTQASSLFILQSILSIVSSQLAQHGGMLNKWMVDDKGSSLIIVFGMPGDTQGQAAHLSTTVRAVEAALGIQSALTIHHIHAKVGITTGRAFSGPIGSEARRELGILGDVVNMSARLMQLGKPGDVVMDEATQRSVAEHFAVRKSAAMIKGRTGPVTVCHLVSRRETNAPAISASRAVDGEFVGRVSELRRLMASVQDVHAQSSTGLVLITGETGIGKSHLIQELARQLDQKHSDTPRTTFLVTKATAFESGTLYFAWRRVFMDLLDLERYHSTEHRLRSLRKQFRALLPAYVDELALLSAVLPMSIPETSASLTLPSTLRAQRTRELLLRLLQAASTARPLVVAIEGATHMDSASIKLAHDVSERARCIRIIMTSRSVDAQGKPLLQQMFARSLTLQLTNLTYDDTRRLACKILEVAEVPKQLVDLLHEKTSGNPLFVKEILRSLVDQSACSVAAGEYAILLTECHFVHMLPVLTQLCRCHVREDLFDDAGLSGVTLPDTIQGMLVGRINQLSASEQLALKVASVLGHSWNMEALQAVYPKEISAEELVGVLNNLEAKGFLAYHTAPDGSLLYTFQQSTQDVAYSLLLFKHRRELHCAVSKYVEETYSADLESHYALLAYHWGRGGDLERQMRYLYLAASAAYACNTPQDALRIFQEMERVRAGAPPDLLPPLFWARVERCHGQSLQAVGQDGQARFCAALSLLRQPLPTSRSASSLTSLTQNLRRWRLNITRRASLPTRRRSSTVQPILAESPASPRGMQLAGLPSPRPSTASSPLASPRTLSSPLASPRSSISTAVASTGTLSPILRRMPIAGTGMSSATSSTSTLASSTAQGMSSQQPAHDIHRAHSLRRASVMQSHRQQSGASLPPLAGSPMASTSSLERRASISSLHALSPRHRSASLAGASSDGRRSARSSMSSLSLFRSKSVLDASSAGTAAKDAKSAKDEALDAMRQAMYVYMEYADAIRLSQPSQRFFMVSRAASLAKHVPRTSDHVRLMMVMAHESLIRSQRRSAEWHIERAKEIQQTLPHDMLAKADIMAGMARVSLLNGDWPDVDVLARSALRVYFDLGSMHRHAQTACDLIIGWIFSGALAKAQHLSSEVSLTCGQARWQDDAATLGLLRCRVMLYMHHGVGDVLDVLEEVGSALSSRNQAPRALTALHQALFAAALARQHSPLAVVEVHVTRALDDVRSTRRTVVLNSLSMWIASQALYDASGGKRPCSKATVVLARQAASVLRDLAKVVSYAKVLAAEATASYLLLRQKTSAATEAIDAALAVAQDMPLVAARVHGLALEVESEAAAEHDAAAQELMCVAGAAVTMARPSCVQ